MARFNIYGLLDLEPDYMSSKQTSTSPSMPGLERDQSTLIIAILF